MPEWGGSRGDPAVPSDGAAPYRPAPDRASVRFAECGWRSQPHGRPDLTTPAATLRPSPSGLLGYGRCGRPSSVHDAGKADQLSRLVAWPHVSWGRPDRSTSAALPGVARGG